METEFLSLSEKSYNHQIKRKQFSIVLNLSIFSQIYLDIDFADDRCDILP